MFYFPAILNRQTGCFSTIWLVATNGKKVSKREYLKVNVPRTCDQLIDYILVRVPAPRPDLPQPRLSLYLASLLQYGVIKVYHHQCNIQLKDTRDVVERLDKFNVKKKIDMGKPGGAMSLPDALFLMEDNEWANDPLFGEMLEGDLASISPSALAGPGGQFHSAWSPPTSSPGTQDSITARPETITMKETTSAVMPLTENFANFGETEGNIDDLEYFGFDAAEEEPPMPEQEPGREGATGGDDMSHLTDPSIEGITRVGDIARSPRRAATPASPEAVLPPATPASPEAVLPPATRSPAAPEAAGDLPVPGDRAAEGSDDEDVPTPPPQRGVKRKRKPRLQVDHVTTIPRQQLMEQLSNLFYQTADPLMAGDVWADPAHLFTRPCNILPLEVMPLWDRVAVIHSYADRQSVAEQRQESSGYSSSEKAPSDDIPAQSSGDISEHGREQPLPSGQISTVWSPGRRSQEGAPVGPEGAAGMDVEMVPEVEAGMDVDMEAEVEAGMDIGPEGEEEEGPDRRAEFMRNFEELDEASVTLKSMLGEGIHSRKAMASAFMILLEQVTGHAMNAEQKEPYDEIWISLGPFYESPE